MLVALTAIRKGSSRTGLGMMADACYIPMGRAPCKFTKVGVGCCHPKTANKLIKNTLVWNFRAMASFSSIANVES